MVLVEDDYRKIAGKLAGKAEGQWKQGTQEGIKAVEMKNKVRKKKLRRK